MTHHFRATLEYKDMGVNARGRLVYQVLRLPSRLQQTLQLGPKGRCRVRGTLDERHEFCLALNPDPETLKHYMMISKAVAMRFAKR